MDPSDSNLLKFLDAYKEDSSKKSPFIGYLSLKVGACNQIEKLHKFNNYPCIAWKMCTKYQGQDSYNQGRALVHFLDLPYCEGWDFLILLQSSLAHLTVMGFTMDEQLPAELILLKLPTQLKASCNFLCHSSQLMH
ncbi:hypothetical protein O181_004530 [Austropuccinia psidii MF-1]|uniref:Uncharacterized protein n=1 Tax=Austropuccinia psidii MF-1 TaxID=1389203 RepID=A0A9Q3GEX9_9BASI|nr:hypothetical protein [Austropuccinia psidii MF-1]